MKEKQAIKRYQAFTTPTECLKLPRILPQLRLDQNELAFERLSVETRGEVGNHWLERILCDNS